jgi:hypothetical protein
MEQEQPAQDSVHERLTNFFNPPEVATEDATEVETAPVETAEVPVETEAEGPEDDSEEFDVDGTVYRLPKELKAKVSEWKESGLRQADYTRKTQELADIHRQAQAMAEAIQHRNTFETETHKEREELSRVTGDLEKYKSVDWQNLDVDTYIKLKGRRSEPSS